MKIKTRGQCLAALDRLAVVHNATLDADNMESGIIYDAPYGFLWSDGAVKGPFYPFPWHGQKIDWHECFEDISSRMICGTRPMTDSEKTEFDEAN